MGVLPSLSLRLNLPLLLPAKVCDFRLEQMAGIQQRVKPLYRSRASRLAPFSINIWAASTLSCVAAYNNGGHSHRIDIIDICAMLN